MKKTIILIILFVGLITACRNKTEIFPDLKVEKTEARVLTEELIEVKITSGSGKYDVKTQDEKKAKVSISKNIVFIEGVTDGEVIVTVLDLNSNRTVQIKVEVSSEKKMTFVSTTIEESKQIINGKTQEIPSDKTKEFWGDRMLNNMPIELQFKKDSLYIVKPNEWIEKYKTEWRGEELFLYNSNLDTWQYCGIRTKNKEFLLNMGFYSIESKTEQRTLRLIGQGYSFQNYTEIGNFPNASIMWTKISFLFKK